MEVKPALVNLSVIAKNYKSGEKVTPKSLVKKGLVHNVGKRNPKVKILGGADLAVKLTVEGCLCSTAAKEGNSQSWRVFSITKIA